MKRITTTVDPGVYRRLEDLARRDGVPAARLIREAMENYVTDREADRTPLPLPDFVGIAAGNRADAGANAEELLTPIIDELYRTEVRNEPKARRDR